jgi:transcription initiation factor TFIIH subunit 4
MNKTPVLPPTVVDQVNLWEMERNRLEFSTGFLYRDFTDDEEFDQAVQYASTLNGLTWQESSKRLMVVSPEAHDQVKMFVKDLLAERHAQV